MSKNPFLHDIPRPKKGPGKILADFIQGIVIAAAFLVITYLFLVIPNQVDGNSMLPNFHNNELLLTNKIIQIYGTSAIAQRYDYDYQRADVVIFQKPGNPDFIKRVIGLPGEQIMIDRGKVYINGQLLDEEYIPDDVQTRTYSTMYEGETITIPAGHYFLIGDNRGNSHDSRFYDIGFVPREWIKGRVFLRYYPFEDFDWIKAGEYSLMPAPSNNRFF